MNKVTGSAIALLVLSSGAVLAQDGTTFDCAEAESSAERLVCDDPSLAALDRRLAERYAAALAVAGSRETGAEDAIATLRAYQRGWISGRDECWKAPDLRTCVDPSAVDIFASCTAFQPVGRENFHEVVESDIPTLSIGGG